MAQNKLYRVLAKLSKRELQTFRSFLLSPYHNQSQTVLSLFDYIRDAHPNFDDDKLESSLIFRHLNDNRLQTSKAKEKMITQSGVVALKNSPEKYVTDRLHDLNKCLEAFLIVNHLRKDQRLKERLLSKALLDYDCSDIYLQKERKFLKKFSKKPPMGYKSHFELWSLHHNYLFHPTTQRFKPEKDALEKVNIYLDKTYALSKFKYGLYELHLKEIFEEQIEKIPSLLEELMEEYASSENPVFQLYISAITYFGNDEKEKAWKALRDLYVEHLEVLPPYEKLTFLTVLVNTGNRIKGNTNACFDGILSLYQEAIKHNFWESLGFIPSITFKNIAALAASKKQFCWASTFIEQHQQSLSKQDRQITVAFAKAYLCFYEGKFEAAKNKLLDIWGCHERLTPHDNLSYRSLYLRCLYELDERQSLAYHLPTFKRFIGTQRLSKTTKGMYGNLIYFVGYLDKEREKGKRSRKSKEEMLAKLEKRMPCAAVNWVKEKIAEL